MLAAQMMPTIATAVHRYNFWAWITYNILVMGRACFLRVPVSEANDLNYLLCFLFFDDGFDVAN